MKDLQEIINNKAKNRAEEKVQKLVDIMHSMDKEILKSFYVKLEEGQTENLLHACWSLNSIIPSKLVEHFTKKYIPEESEKFVKQVEKLSKEIEDLKTDKYEY